MFSKGKSAGTGPTSTAVVSGKEQWDRSSETRRWVPPPNTQDRLEQEAG